MVLVITAARLLLLWFNAAELLPQEIRLWLWGTAPSLSHGGAPPLAGWLMALAALPGDTPFWLRLPAPLLIAGAALILGGIADRLLGPRAAWITALAFVTLPGAALASQVLDTQTVMAPFLAGSLALYLRLLDRRESWAAAGAGLLLGLAVLSDPRALAYPLCAVLAAMVFHEARPSRRHGALIAGLAGAAILPYEVHALAHAPALPGIGLHVGAAAAFLIWQAGFLGPILFAALVLAIARAGRQAPVVQFLLVFCIPVLGLGVALAFLFDVSGWTAMLAGLPVAAVWLARHSRIWLAAALALNVAASTALPLAALAPHWVELPGPGLFARHVGRAEMARTILDIGQDLAIRAVVAADPALRLDLLYTGRHGTIPILPVEEAAALPDGSDILLVQPEGAPAPCPAEVMDLAVLDAATGAYAARPQGLLLVPASCLNAGPDL